MPKFIVCHTIGKGIKKIEMTQEETDKKYMQRCIQLAKNGRQNAKPNPMVGAVLVFDDRIIGEGYHVRCGEGHAEVNCFASVKPDVSGEMLSKSTLYVSLEPCSHYGRTPPCADLIIRKGVKRVVIGCIDPFAKVQGRGIKKIQEAGIDVTVGVLEQECKELNKRFTTFNTDHRPYIILKWCQTSNGFLDDNFHQMAISTPFTKMLSHKLRAENDAILIGRVTDDRDHSQLNVRDWAGPNPKRIVLSHPMTIPQLLSDLYAQDIQSLIVEGGTKTHNSFLDAGLWDEIRVETAPITVTGGTPAPHLPANVTIISQEQYDGNVIRVYEKA
jgi:diaminohydroxyphosphoribosylaminopyrimidine deaminase/5-amino-6-(5-phosphoribosylamino)uracil reductase